jgi:hypothetical protein
MRKLQQKLNNINKLTITRFNSMIQRNINNINSDGTNVLESTAHGFTEKKYESYKIGT